MPVPPGGSVADYRVGARDLRLVVEELWLAGAEAVSVNGERLVPTTAFVDIGGTLLVNSAYLAPPYQVAAIGPAGPVRRPRRARPGSSSSSRRARTGSGSGSRSRSRIA